MNPRKWVVISFCLLFTASAFADFRYQETTTITGGSMIRMMKVAGIFSKAAKEGMQPVTSTVYVKGNRMARVNPEVIEIIDLDRGTFTNIDLQKKQYTVTTFEQMKEQMEAAQRQAARQAKAAPPQAKADNPPPPQMEFKANVRNTGLTKQVSGLDTKQAILTLVAEAANQQPGQQGALAFTDELWLAPDIPGYSEVRDFQRRLAMKMGMMFSGALRPSIAASQPGSSQGMAQLSEQMSQLRGVPMMQVMRMGVTANGQPLPAASESPSPSSDAKNSPGAGEIAKKGVTSAITGRFGLGGFGHKKKQEEEQPADDRKQPEAQSIVLLESSTQINSFSSGPVDASVFELPAGYREVAPQPIHVAAQQ